MQRDDAATEAMLQRPKEPSAMRGMPPWRRGYHTAGVRHIFDQQGVMLWQPMIHWNP